MRTISLPQLSIEQIAETYKARKTKPSEPGGMNREMAMALLPLVNRPMALAEAIKALPLTKPAWAKEASKLVAWIEGGMTAQLPYTVFAEGNSKLPFYAFSALPFVTCPGAGQCSNWCYSLTAWRYPAAFFRQVMNTLLIQHRKGLLAAAFMALPADITLRLYVDGDFDSVETVAFWMDLLAKRADIKAYGYSKSWHVLLAYANDHAYPSNYVLNLSSGSRFDGNSIMADRVSSLSCVRGRFVAVPTTTNADYTNKANWLEHAAEVRKVAMALGYGKVYVCPGRCGTCTNKGHACGSKAFQNVTIAIGIH